MFTFIKQLFGFDKPTMKEAGVQLEQAPYKVPEPVAPIQSPLVDIVVPPTAFDVVPPTVTAPVAEPVPAKKPRKPRTPKAPVAEKPAVKKAAPVKKAAAIKAAPKAKTTRSKKV